MKRLLLCISLTLGLPACGGLFCDSASCGCEPPAPAKRYDIVGAVLTPVSRADGGLAVISAGEAVSRAALTLLLTLDTKLVAHQAKPAGWGAAYACSPAEPQFTEQVASITVTTLNVLDAQHPAGSSINDLLQLYSFGQLSSYGLLDDYTRTYKQQPIQRVELKLADFERAYTGPHQFRVEYKLTNGEVYTAETPLIVLTQ